MPNYRILLVFPKGKQMLEEEIREKLEEKLCEENPSQPCSVTVDTARNEADALHRFNETAYGLVICYLNLPIDSKATVREDEQRGLFLIRSFKRDKPRIPVILIATTTDNRVSDCVSEYGDCRSIQEGKELEDNLLELSKRLISRCPILRPTCRVDLLIDLDETEETSIGGYHIESPVIGTNLKGKILLNSRTMKNILEDSKKLEKDISNRDGSVKDWESQFQRLGEELTKEIQERNTKFVLRLKDAALKVDGFENVRIRFILKEDCHSIIFEALMDQEGELLMLQAPMYRRLNLDRYGGPPPLFMEGQARDDPINCLIIEADTKGFVKEMKRGDISLDELPNIQAETARLVELFQEKNKGRVQLISRRTIPKGKTFFEYLSDELIQNPMWDLVHFTGHSLCDTDNTGYLILPRGRRKEGEKDKLEISKFANLLRMARTRFLYLDSCESSAASMVFKLAEQQIPAIMGFRWAVQAKMAVLYAENFYKHLFEEGSLEDSFFYARKEIHEKYNDPQSSAALLLILQTP